jgi:hypothetical protein
MMHLIAVRQAEIVSAQLQPGITTLTLVICEWPRSGADFGIGRAPRYGERYRDNLGEPRGAAKFLLGVRRSCRDGIG